MLQKTEVFYLWWLLKKCLMVFYYIDNDPRFWQQAKSHEWKALVMFFFPDIAKIEKTNPGLISERQSGLEKPKSPKLLLCKRVKKSYE